MESNHWAMIEIEAASPASEQPSRADQRAQAAPIESHQGFAERREATRSMVAPEKGTSKMQPCASLNMFSLDAHSHVEANDHNDTFSFWYRIWLETRREVDAQWTASPRSTASSNELPPPGHRDGPGVACHAP
jgi:hypothetical protein